MDVILYSKILQTNKRVDNIDLYLNGYEETCTVTRIDGLNHKQTTTAYESGTNYRTFYMPVEMGKKYTISCTRKTGQSTPTNVRVCLGENVPASGVSANWLFTKAVDATIVTFDYIAEESGYLGLSSYYDNSEGIENVNAYSGQTGIIEEINDLYNAQVNNESLWQEGYYGATTGDYQYFPSSLPSMCMIDGISEYIKSITCPETVKMRVHAWDNGTYKGTWNGSGFSVVSGASIQYYTELNMETLRTGRSSYVMKLVLVNAEDQTIPVTVSDVEKVKMYAGTGYEIQLIGQLSTKVNNIEKRLTTGTDYCIDSNFLKKGIQLTEIGTIRGAQAFCVYNNKYYSCYGANLYRQSSNFTEEATQSVSIGHGNALMLGSNGVAYASGWDDDTVYVINLESMAVTSTIELPVSGYTTCAVDDVNQIMYIFSRTDGTSTVDNWTFTVWDYANDNILLTKKITNAFAAIQGVDFYNGRILVAWGLGTNVAPSGIAVYNTNGDMLCEYRATAISSNEPEGVCFDRATNRLLFSTITQKVFLIEPKV